MAASPMMQQYQEAKAACGDALLLFRMGDFYELFHDDAKEAARVLSITLTSRDKGTNPIPMAGFPHHQLESYLAKLIRAGFRVAVCEQVSDPKESKGLVQREVQRIVSAGTLTDDALLDPSSSNLLVAITPAVQRKSDKKSKKNENENENENETIGLAWVELSTGRFEANVIPRSMLADELARLEPSEILQREDATFVEASSFDDWVLTTRPAWQFGIDEAEKVLHQHFQIKDLSGFGWTESDLSAIVAAGAALAYLNETQKVSLSHIQSLLPARHDSSLQIDSATRRSLELTQTLRHGERDGSLLHVMDRTVTPMGARCLMQWLASPLVSKEQIDARLDAVDELFRDDPLREDCRQALDQVFDLERLLGRIATGRCSPRDLLQVGRTLEQIPPIIALLDLRSSSMLETLRSQLDPCSELREQISSALVNDCPLQAKAGGFIAKGFDAKLDELRELAAGGKEWIVRYQADQIEKSGITSLKVGFNNVFGYYLEVTNAHKDKVPESYIRKQTLKNAERYITSELKEYEEKVLSADQAAKELEYELFLRLRDNVFDKTAVLQRNAAVLAYLDVLSGLAELAKRRNYVRPRITEDLLTEIFEGRHPVLDATMDSGKFVPNDTLAGIEHGNVMLITGPNMAGKSTYIRQTALLSIMAQMGSFIPASKATIGIADKVFARVGASDELARGQSTFMVEMVETARILNTATQRSLIILDEIGRGTSTYDGLSLAWSIVEHLHNQVKARTFFATHYHELIELEKSLPGVRNLNVAVKEWDDNVVFLHRIVPGGADRSYGIHVARLAGVPKAVNSRAKDVLAQLELDHVDRNGKSKILAPQSKTQGPIQMTLFEWTEHPVIEELRKTEIDALSPLEALQLLHQWKNSIGD